jgi:hypothetical protein
VRSKVVNETKCRQKLLDLKELNTLATSALYVQCLMAVVRGEQAIAKQCPSRGAVAAGIMPRSERIDEKSKAWTIVFLGGLSDSG